MRFAIFSTLCEIDSAVATHWNGNGEASEVAGAARAPEIIQRELDLPMAFCGRTGIAQVDPGIVARSSPPWAQRVA